MGTWGDLNKGSIFQQMSQPKPAGKTATGNTWGDLNKVTAPPPPPGTTTRPITVTNTPVSPPVSPPTTPQQPKGDIWEQIQNETRKGTRYDEYATMHPLATAGGTHHLGSPGDPRTISPEQQRVLAQYGVKPTWNEGYTTGPMGEGATIENVPGGWSVDGWGSYDTSKMPKTVFGSDFRILTERDKGLVPKPEYIVWDDNYGWITHKDNYNQNGNESWFMQNAKWIMPALFTAGLGFAGVAPAVTASTNLGRSAVDIIGGNKPWPAILPTLLGMGISASGISDIIGKLPTTLLRTGGNMAISNLLTRGRKG